MSKGNLAKTTTNPPKERAKTEVNENHTQAKGPVRTKIVDPTPTESQTPTRKMAIKNQTAAPATSLVATRTEVAENSSPPMSLKR